MRVLLADDQVWLRSAIRFLLEEEPDVGEIDEAGDLRTVLTKAKTHAPSLVLLDWELPGLHAKEAGRKLISALRASSPDVMVIVLSGRPEASKRALDAGADGFVSKADPPDTLLAIVRRVAATHARRDLTSP
jgi:DNA-binding NarL/FixJ family response regulator